ncbi:unnamed protein product (macronuclear) [Paramecium tetraurelia]|uniref:Uncharacterized protein n=1 Tax=Paramecium tetraurelia TaxID=5888 RepID=A0BW86_PARTE|nr:uncharacterized protein GSPATT00032655001 [Paramecium tetraurelia]CAK62803.1 unnamed protein product [Paramecium tetraurelia]|eukprot:XP_001430201.1 hypothetical protein (macronuclear) [Paramecium tetraurelia strain d4-2]
MQNNAISNSLYFSKHTHFKQNIYRGYFVFKNANFSILETRNKSRYDSKHSEPEDQVFVSSSVQQIPSQRRITYDNSNIEDSQIQQVDKKGVNKRCTTNLRIMQKEQQILPQLSSSQQVVRMKLQSRQLKAKPIVKKQKSLEHAIHLRYLNKQYEELQKGIMIKCLFLNINNREEYLDKVIILNFENLLLQSKRNFWDHKTDLKICHSFSIGSLIEQCDSPYCPCTLRSDLKNTLRILSKAYLIVLLFTSQTFAQVWSKYLSDNGYTYDAIYLSKQQSQTIECGGIKLNRLLRDFSKFKILKILIFDSIDISNTFPKIPPEQFQYRLPIHGTDVETILFIFQQIQNPKQFDSKVIFDICTSFQNDQNIVISRKPVTILSVDLTQAYNYFNQKEELLQDKQYILSKLSAIQEEFNKNISQFDPSLLQEQEDQVYKWVDTTRNRILDQIKSKFQEKIPLLHFTVGDLIVRNHKFKALYFNYPQSQLVKKETQLNKKINKIDSETQVYQNKQKNHLLINCFLCVE